MARTNPDLRIGQDKPNKLHKQIYPKFIHLFFILKIYGISEIVNKTKSMFGSEFNERLFREQLSYFDDIDYTEKIDYVVENYVSDDEIKRFLSDTSLQV